jgi:hypothetical protein
MFQVDTSMHPPTRVFRILLATLMTAGVAACSTVSSVTKAPPTAQVPVPSVPPATLQSTVIPDSSQPSSSFASSSRISFNVGIDPREIAVADLNDDSRLDAVVANSGDGTLTILLGTGDERLLNSPLSVYANQNPSDVDALDIDLDGDVDLVVANHETSGITVLLNDGLARFEQAPYSPVETGAQPHLHGLATADFNGDGWPDVAVDSADTGQVRMIHGSSLGFLDSISVDVETMPYFRLGASDVIGGDVTELLVPGHSDNTIRLIQYESDRYIIAQTIKLEAQPWMVVGADVDADGRNDVIVVETDSVSIWLADSEGYSAAQASPYLIRGATEITTGDMNGDHISDIVVGSWDSEEVIVFMGRDLVTSRFHMCQRPIGLAVADLDGDGKSELLATCPLENRLMVAFPVP